MGHLFLPYRALQSSYAYMHDDSSMSKRELNRFPILHYGRLQLCCYLPPSTSVLSEYLRYSKARRVNVNGYLESKWRLAHGVTRGMTCRHDSMSGVLISPVLFFNIETVASLYVKIKKCLSVT